MNELETLNKIQTELLEILGKDRRTFEQREYCAENDYYFDGVFDAYKIVRRYRNELIEKSK